MSDPDIQDMVIRRDAVLAVRLPGRAAPTAAAPGTASMAVRPVTEW